MGFLIAGGCIGVLWLRAEIFLMGWPIDRMMKKETEYEKTWMSPFYLLPSWISREMVEFKFFDWKTAGLSLRQNTIQKPLIFEFCM